MRYNSRILTMAILIGLSGPALAAAPDLLPPISMLVDPGSAVIAQGLDFLDAPLSGAVNFSPQNYDIHLGGELVLPVQDAIPYFSVQQPLKDCQGVAAVVVGSMMPYINALTQYIFPKVLGVAVPKKNIIDPIEVFNGFMMQCNNDPKLIDMLMTQGKLPAQLVADVRNTSAGATDIIFSGQALDPVSEFPRVPMGYVGTVIGGGSTSLNDVWNDGVIIAGYEDSGFAGTFGTPLISSSLALYRFLPNAAQKKVMQLVGLSTGWLDKAAQTNGKITNPCFKGNPDPANPTLKTNAELLAAGCVGENHVVGLVAPNLYGHQNDKLKDLVVLSRSPMGDPKDPASKIGYLTTYKRTDKVPDDASIFQDLWQFDKSVTNAANGIPEPYGLAVLKGKPADSIVATSNTPILNAKTGEGEYFIYRYAEGLKEAIPIRVGCNLQKATPTCPLLRRGAGPYKVYTADINGDSCDDILLTRAFIGFDKITQNMDIHFAPYVDLFLQGKAASGECDGTFDDTKNVAGIAQTIPQWDAKIRPQISSVAAADYNKDGKLDVIAGDFSTYMDPTTKKRTNYAYFLENKAGLLNTMQDLPHFTVSTKEHASNVGVIDVKADAHANLGVVTGNAMVFEEVKIQPPVIIVPNPCIVAGGVGGNVPGFCKICGRDNDNDGFKDIPENIKVVDVPTCENGQMVTKQMAVDLTLFTYTPDCAKPELTATKSGRQWMHELVGCDNCNPAVGIDPNSGDVCTGPEAGGIPKCFNPSQKDANLDGYGDICSPNPNAGKALPAGPGVPIGKCVDGKTDYMASWLNFQVIENGAGVSIDNDKDQDGIPDCLVQLDADNKPSNLNCAVDCDSCNPQSFIVNTKLDCSLIQNKDVAKPECYNPDQKDKCTVPAGAFLKPLREDKMMYADDQPVLAYKEELKLTGVPSVDDNGHEVTVLLNKNNAKPVPPKPCQNGDLECICKQNPDLQACKCLKDPAAPGCKTGPVAQVTCCLDVCRGDLTAAFPAMCDFIRPYNDEIRKITGLCMDVLVPVEGTQYHLSCTMPNAPVLDLGGGKAYAQVFKSSGGQIPKNYFKDWHKPVASQNLLSNNVLLNPLVDAATGGAQFDVNKLPKPDFAFDASLSAVAPDVSVNQAPGITQIDGVMQIETYVADLDPATGAPVTKQVGGAVPPAVAKALLLDIKGFSSPAGCQWGGSDCPDMMPNPPSPQAFVDAIKSKVLAEEAAGKPITINTINEAFKSMDVGPAFLHQKFVVGGGQNAMVVPVQNVMGVFGAEGGCGCTFAAPTTMHNTVLPLLMAASALSGMIFLRRNMGKKR